MGKRSDFPRIDRDFYPTPYEAVIPLLSHLKIPTGFDEPCYGDGDLARHLWKNGHVCMAESDIKGGVDALSIDQCLGDCFITNPPWDRKILHPLILHLSSIAPTWLLFDADWMHTKQSAEYMKCCVKIVSVGRVKWIPDSKMTGKDNCAWYLFGKEEIPATAFYGRAA